MDSKVRTEHPAPDLGKSTLMVRPYPGRPRTTSAASAGGGPVTRAKNHPSGASTPSRVWRPTLVRPADQPCGRLPDRSRPAALAGPLGLVHRGVGAAQQFVRRLVALAGQRDTDAGRDVRPVLAE